MKKFNVFILFNLFCFGSFAQQNLEIGVSTGFTNYYGDLGNGEFMQKSSMNPGLAVTVRNLIPSSPGRTISHSSFNLEARISWNRIQYDESLPVDGKSGWALQNFGRGLNFRNDLLGFSSHFRYTFYPNRRLPPQKQRLSFFVFTGAGVFYGRPKADLFRGDVDLANRYFFWRDGTIRDTPQSSGMGNVIGKDGVYETDLIQWRTEGQGSGGESSPSVPQYSPWNIGIPLAAGFQFSPNRLMKLSVEFAYYIFFTDYLDDVSTDYATDKQLAQLFPGDRLQQELAGYISDPTGYGTNGMKGPATSRRGNPSINDSFSFISVEFAVRLSGLRRN